MEFTQEIKDNWLEALKSGKYTQGYFRLQHKNKFCCIGVLGDITDGLNNDFLSAESSCNPYKFLGDTIGKKPTEELHITNDKMAHVVNHEYKDDYSNVIPLIEALEVSV